MRIAVTNDDGIEAPGIAVMARRLRDAGHDVVVAAPDREFSGAGASVGADLRKVGGVLVRERDVDGIPGFAVEGPPALCSLLAIRGAFGDPVGFVVSGINAGPNMGPSILHSGTVGAVVTAGNFGVSGLAVSLAIAVERSEGHFDTAAAVAEVVVARMLADEDGDRALVGNLNVPDIPVEDLRGLHVTTLDATPGFRSTGVEVQEVEAGTRRMRFVYERLEVDPPVGSDVGSLAAGYASLGWIASLQCVDPPHWHGELDELVAHALGGATTGSRA